MLGKLNILHYVMNILLTSITLLLLSTLAFGSDNITIPNSFNSGSTISSSQMNENFNSITNFLNKNSDFHVYSNGNKIGKILNIDLANSIYILINSEGYTFALTIEGTHNNSFTSYVYYSNTDCTGDTFIETKLIPNAIYEYRAELYYQPNNPEQIQLSNVGYYLNGVCNVYPYERNLHPFIKNNSTITNVLNVYQTPLTIE